MMLTVEEGGVCLDDVRHLRNLYRLGVRCYWNFSHYDIAAKYPDAIVENVHLNDTLMTLSYRITNSN